MPLYVIDVPDPPAGTDFVYTVPGQYLENITTVTARLNATGPVPCPCFPANEHSACAFATVFGPPTGSLTLPIPSFDPLAGPWTVEAIVRGLPDGSSADMQVIATHPLVNAPGVEALAITSSALFGGIVSWDNGQGNQMGYGAKPGRVECWSHLCITSGGSGAGKKVTAYWDGVQVAQANANIYVQTAFDSVQVGGHASPRTAQAFGAMSDVSLYHAELSAAQVAAHAALVCTDMSAYRAAVLADGPQVYYVLDDAVGSVTAADASGNAFTANQFGTLVFGAPGVGQNAVPPNPARTVLLDITDGTTLVAEYPPSATQPDSTGTDYSWIVGAPSQASVPGTQAIPLPNLVLPAGYTIGSSTAAMQPADQWTDIKVWWNSDLMDMTNRSDPFVYPPGAYLHIVPTQPT